jgi:hypothetical protein
METKLIKFAYTWRIFGYTVCATSPRTLTKEESRYSKRWHIREKV